MDKDYKFKKDLLSSLQKIARGIENLCNLFKEDLPDEYINAEVLARGLWIKRGNDPAEWEPAEDVLGLLSQIENMVG